MPALKDIRNKYAGSLGQYSWDILELFGFYHLLQLDQIRYDISRLQRYRPEGFRQEVSACSDRLELSVVHIQHLNPNDIVLLFDLPEVNASISALEPLLPQCIGSYVLCILFDAVLVIEGVIGVQSARTHGELLLSVGLLD